MNDPAMLRYWVLLSKTFGAGGTRVLEALREFETPQQIWEAVSEGRVKNLTPAVKRNVEQAKVEQADMLVDFCLNNHIELLPITDPRYPELLRTIYAPPFLLTAQGEMSLLQKELTLAVVGTRHPSPYSVKVTEYIVSDICRDDFVIVSGFANGIDTAAHTAALNAGGTTIAVLGCGVNYDYPRENVGLKQSLLASGRGLLISEYLPGTSPLPANFPKRNRILSGLAQATAVIEAAYGSGSLLTAECASEQGRHLLCVPPQDIFDPRYAGALPLLRDGAIPLMSAGDVRAVYYGRYPQHVSLPETVRNSELAVYAEENAAIQADAERRKAAGKREKKQEKPAEKAMPVPKKAPARKEPMGLPAEKPQRAKRTDLPDSEEGARIVQYLRQHGSADVDTLARELDINPSTLLSTLMLLELDDFVRSLFGKQYFPAE